MNYDNNRFPVVWDEYKTTDKTLKYRTCMYIKRMKQVIKYILFVFKTQLQKAYVYSVPTYFQEKWGISFQ